MPSVGQLIRDAAAAMTKAGLNFGHGTDNAWDEATALVLAVTGLADRAANLEQPVAAEAAARIHRLLDRRIETRVPLAWLLGRWRFAGHEFLVQPGVVVPRSPIGELIEGAFRPWLRRPPGRVLDLGAGSGCIGIATALRFPEAEVHLVEIDPGAAALAGRNVALHGLEERVFVHQGDLFEPLPGDLRFHLVLSNPPYVDDADMARLPPEFRAEPARGLAGGADGLDLVRRIVDQAPQRLEAGGLLVCEVGRSAPALLEAYPHLPFLWPDFRHGGEGVFILGADLT